MKLLIKKPITIPLNLKHTKNYQRIVKRSANGRFLLRQICTDLIIDTNICLLTNSFTIENNLQRQLLITYQNDIILTSMSSKIDNYLTRCYLYTFVGLISGLTTSIIIQEFNIWSTICFALSMGTISNFRYKTVNNIELNLYEKFPKSIILISFGLRTINDLLGSLQYLFITSLISSVSS